VTEGPPRIALNEPTWPEARLLALKAGLRTARTRTPLTIALGDARDLVLATDVRSTVDLPTFDTAAMDGWAVSGPGPWHIVGDVLAGQHVPSLASGEAVRISTGAMVPQQSGVLRSERGTEHGDIVELNDDAAAPTVGSDTRRAGEEVRAGEVILRVGQVMTPPAIGLAAAAGHDTLSVIPSPTVAILVLGDELVDRGVPQLGQVRDALAPQLPGWVASMHGALTSIAPVEDSLAATIAAISSVDADVVITTGGTARGPADHIRGAVEHLDGQWLVDGVAVRPGHPMKLAALPGGRHVVALPGNPLAAISGLMTLGEPLIAAASGRVILDVASSRTLVSRPLGEAVEASPGSHRLIPAQIKDGHVHPSLRRGPAMLTGLATADVLAVVSPGPSPVDAGSQVDVLPLPWGTGLVV